MAENQLERLEALRKKKRLAELRAKQNQSAAPKEMSWGEAIKQYSPTKTLKSAPQDTADVAEVLLRPIMRPDEFASEMMTLGKGFLQKTAKDITSVVGESIGMDEPMKAPIWDAVSDSVKEHYKGYLDPETAKQRLEENPASVALDIYTILTGATGVKRMASGTAKSLYTDKLPKSMIEESMKLTTSPKGGLKSLANRDKVLSTVLREKDAWWSPEGAWQLADVINAQNKLIDQVIKAQGKGIKYPRLEVVRGLAEVSKQKLGKWRGGKRADVVKKRVLEYIDDIGKLDDPTMSLAELQQFKKDAYKQINWAVPTSKQTLENEIAKSVALTAKSDIETYLPGEYGPLVKAMNRREGDALQALEHVMRSGARVRNKNFAGMDAALKPAMGGMGATAFGLDPGVGIALGGTAHLLGREPIKGRLAQALYNYRRAPSGVEKMPLIMAPALLNLQNQGRQ